MQKLKAWLWLSAGVLIWVLSTHGHSESRWNMTEGVTEISRSVYRLHMLIFWVCVGIGIIVFGIMIYSMLMHRKSRGVQAANFHESTLVEIIWTVVPFAILIAMAIPAARTLAQIYERGPAEVTIEIVGYQWKWQYRYVSDTNDAKVAYFSTLATPPEQIANKVAKDENYLLEVSEPLVIPTNQRVRLLITSNDVIHSWWVPALGVKKDAIPGIVNESWTKVEQAGLYRGQCAELCGKDHGFMPIVVDVREPEEFQTWLAAKQDDARKMAELTNKTWTLTELVDRGEKVYGQFCVACHQANGMGVEGAFPALKGSAVATGDINKHIAIILNGVNGTAMQAFGKQLSEVDLAAVVTYERNAWGNNMGDMVAPLDIVKFKSGQQE
ncbi:cytochrome c oxidase subunit II [Gynuella sunshinyii]|uniref:Cytochrome c oxidase subunit 2 n=1 Tax=Gynuella sunshinyii YC6258 TaxID=1445510 RepID=A0A0C5VRC4_9GAMM|nr:cytochrome c oxidase subunit II [Gynuella sunshinyii]AJQ92774.1 heme/copper-type cytochrome/quinol oxidase, subunit 2 [Gynuella sunshinyii YC6258]